MPSKDNLWKHSNALYDRMKAESKYVEGVGHVWTGFLTRLILTDEGLGLPTPYYSLITGALKQVDSIRQLKRGGGAQPSEWLILEMPDRQMFNWKLDSDRMNAKGTHKVTRETLLQQSIDGINATVLDLRRRIERLESA